MKKLLFALVLGFSTATAQAMTIEDYKEYKQGSPEKLAFLKAYVAGLSMGMQWANIKLIFENQNPLYCEPPKLALNVDNLMGMIDRQIRDGGRWDVAEMHIGPLLMEELIATFPCEGRR
jgi:hypothetical protein